MPSRSSKGTPRCADSVSSSETMSHSKLYGRRYEVSKLRSRFSAISVVILLVGITVGSPALIRADGENTGHIKKMLGSSIPSFNIFPEAQHANMPGVSVSSRIGINVGVSWSSVTRLELKFVATPYKKGD